MYEDDWSYTCSVNMKVKNGQVYVYEHDNEEKKPDSLRRTLTVKLEPLQAALHATDEQFIMEMKKMFGCSKGTIMLREFLYKNGIQYTFQEFYNMFVFWENLSIRHHAHLNTTADEFNDSLLKWHGYSLRDRSKEKMTYKGNLPVFGPCIIYVDVPTSLTIGHVRIVTERKVSEQEMLLMLDYMKKSLYAVPHFDDHGYHGVKPAPHEIELVWEMEQGNIGMKWDGFRYNFDNIPEGGGYDYVSIDLWDGTVIRRSRDEEYWRSEVD